MATLKDVNNALESLREITGNSRLEVANVGGSSKYLLDTWTDGETGKLRQVQHMRLGVSSTEIHRNLSALISAWVILKDIPNLEAL